LLSGIPERITYDEVNEACFGALIQSVGQAVYSNRPNIRKADIALEITITPAIFYVLYITSAVPEVTRRITAVRGKHMKLAGLLTVPHKQFAYQARHKEG
jgi:hypothetical protein